ncbi:MAG: VCBS repeat-containing protein [Rhodocyclaceae bacterium]|nr:VCBS repeat-containing protein [Rhodocyclaceae bacterium]MBX3667572.1 VCBS repeat-containing protein [Rhodocyclaceae bacterium]
MKIAASGMELNASHSYAQTTSQSLSLKAWIGDTRPDFEHRAAPQAAPEPARPLVQISDAGRMAAANDSAAAQSADAEGAAADPLMGLVKSILERIFGQSIKLVSAADLHGNPPPAALPAPAAAHAAEAGAPPRAGFGIEFDMHETVQISEQSSFSAQGQIRTADGRTLQFQLDLQMSYSETHSTDLSLRAGDAVKKDPLVINFGGTAAQLTNQRFAFDLDGDGNKEALPGLASGSGFLVLAAAGEGTVESGKQLFGPTSGDGYAELARYDSDGNGWIDEADPVFASLGVWTPDTQGDGTVASLSERGIGALYLGSVATPFSLRSGSELGSVRSSGVYLNENGSAGSMQQIDLNV